MDILECMYYITSIAVSFFAIYSTCTGLKIVTRSEIIFLNSIQKLLLKHFMFFRFVLSYMVVYASSLMFKLVSDNFILYDFVFYFIVLISCDFSKYLKSLGSLNYVLYKCSKKYLHLKNKQLLFKISSWKTALYMQIICKCFLSVLLSIVSHVMLVVFKAKFILFQMVIFLFVWLYIDKKQIYSSKCRKYLKDYEAFKWKVNYIILYVYEQFMIIKLIAYKICLNITITYENVLQINYKELIYSTVQDKQNGKIFLFILFFSLIEAFIYSYRIFDIHAYLKCYGKMWQIISVSKNDYLLCTCNNAELMIKVENVKDDFFCLVLESNFYFYEKEEILKILK